MGDGVEFLRGLDETERQCTFVDYIDFLFTNLYDSIPCLPRQCEADAYLDRRGQKRVNDNMHYELRQPVPWRTG